MLSSICGRQAAPDCDTPSREESSRRLTRSFSSIRVSLDEFLEGKGPRSGATTMSSRSSMTTDFDGRSDGLRDCMDNPCAWLWVPVSGRWEPFVGRMEPAVGFFEPGARRRGTLPTWPVAALTRPDRSQSYEQTNRVLNTHGPRARWVPPRAPRIEGGTTRHVATGRIPTRARRVGTEPSPSSPSGSVARSGNVTGRARHRR